MSPRIRWRRGGPGEIDKRDFEGVYRGISFRAYLRSWRYSRHVSHFMVSLDVDGIDKPYSHKGTGGWTKGATHLRRIIRSRIDRFLDRTTGMRLVPLYCPTCPDWYDVPDGCPDAVWFAGEQDPTGRPLEGRYVPMDYGHDWKYQKGRIRYMYSHGAECWVVLQYGLATPMKDCGNCGKAMPDVARFCPFCGAPLPPFT